MSVCELRGVRRANVVRKPRDTRTCINRRREREFFPRYSRARLGKISETPRLPNTDSSGRGFYLLQRSNVFFPPDIRPCSTDPTSILDTSRGRSSRKLRRLFSDQFRQRAARSIRRKPRAIPLRALRPSFNRFVLTTTKCGGA